MPNLSIPTLLAFLSLPMLAHTQERNRPGDNRRPLPLQGEGLPEVTAYDSGGNPVALKQALKGRHGVIVFGCLT